MAPYRIDLVDENDTRRLLLGLLEHVADTGRAHADKHFDKIGAGDREERHFSFTRDRLGQQRLTRSRLPYHEHATGNTTAQLLETAGVAQKFDQLLHVFLCLFNTCHIGKRRGDLILPQQLGFTLSKAHRAATTSRSTLHLSHKEHENGDD